jgi:hypothetical protein
VTRVARKWQGWFALAARLPRDGHREAACSASCFGSTRGQTRQLALPREEFTEQVALSSIAQPAGFALLPSAATRKRPDPEYGVELDGVGGDATLAVVESEKPTPVIVTVPVRGAGAN